MATAVFYLLQDQGELNAGDITHDGSVTEPFTASFQAVDENPTTLRIADTEHLKFNPGDLVEFEGQQTTVAQALSFRHGSTLPAQRDLVLTSPLTLPEKSSGIITVAPVPATPGSGYGVYVLTPVEELLYRSKLAYFEGSRALRFGVVANALFERVDDRQAVEVTSGGSSVVLTTVNPGLTIPIDVQAVDAAGDPDPTFDGDVLLNVGGTYQVVTLTAGVGSFTFPRGTAGSWSVRSTPETKVEFPPLFIVVANP